MIQRLLQLSPLVLASFLCAVLSSLTVIVAGLTSSILIIGAAVVLSVLSTTFAVLSLRE